MEGSNSIVLPLRGTRNVVMGNTEDVLNSEPRRAPLTAANLALLSCGQGSRQKPMNVEESEDKGVEITGEKAGGDEGHIEGESTQVKPFAWSAVRFTAMRQKEKQAFMDSAMKNFWLSDFLDRMPLKPRRKQGDMTTPQAFTKWPKGIKMSLIDLAHHTELEEAIALLDEVFEKRKVPSTAWEGLDEDMIDEAKEIAWKRYLKGNMSWCGANLH
ncbi:hypothetical protein CB0940_08882 [Cercospora beticola]|uniref:Uncharacterized protein n=1 Tax=Cercospora beticola TaxID=122368 RepID=A0A2G5HQ43_CERBT|nr:hypothetical protein CB0940_08882 [Cercospora beticola]PIA94650.1 hypothetical protein CB0940_08882 [Cercospora beticola]WPB05474.1 hypothetical protein RHO25_010126 [Cercospora beticola]